jgi:hypothetical protein
MAWRLRQSGVWRARARAHARIGDGFMPPARWVRCVGVHFDNKAARMHCTANYFLFLHFKWVKTPPSKRTLYLEDRNKSHGAANSLNGPLHRSQCSSIE